MGEDHAKGVIEDILLRFIATLPPSELENERLFVHLEQAHWFYDDHVLKDVKLPSMNLKTFCLKACKYSKPLNKYVKSFAQHWEKFRSYQRSVPACGAIVLTPNLKKVLLVKGWNNSKWGFPKGKINQGEDPAQCAIREVQEEIGYDISNLIEEKDYLEGEERQTSRVIRLYIVTGVAESSHFECKTQKEISAIQWFEIFKLEGQMSKKHLYTVLPFLPGLRQWIKRRRKKSRTSKLNGQKSQPESCTKDMTPQILSSPLPLGKSKPKHASEKPKRTKRKTRTPKKSHTRPNSARPTSKAVSRKSGAMSA
eukprot:1336166-Amorphochlora_amoeboformis.AAC.2